MSKIKVHPVGGYSEVGKNMTALDLGDDVILLDSGLFLPAVIGVTEREKIPTERGKIPTERGMRSIGAIPDDLYLDKKGMRDKVRALLISHAHLDHVGGVQYNAHRYKCPVAGTPFTTELLKQLLMDNKKQIPNKIIPVKPNGTLMVKGKKRDYKVEFINMTHSTIQSSIVAIHTPDGVVLYSNDFKLDNTPVYGDKPNYKRLKELSKEGVKAIILDSLYAPDDRKTPSEKIAKGLLEDVVFTTENRKSGMVISTFSSHIARLKTIASFGEKLNRKVIFLGRSLNKYVTAARNVDKAPFINQIKICTYRRQVEKMLHKINNNKKDYLVVCTGHQGEPGSMLDRVSRSQVPLKLGKEDHLILSSRTIPTPENEITRGEMQARIRKKKVRIFDGLHVSGHGGREDMRDLIKLTEPEHIIPSHGDFSKTRPAADLAVEMGYKQGKTVHLVKNQKIIPL